MRTCLRCNVASISQCKVLKFFSYVAAQRVFVWWFCVSWGFWWAGSPNKTIRQKDPRVSTDWIAPCLPQEVDTVGDSYFYGLYKYRQVGLDARRIIGINKSMFVFFVVSETIRKKLFPSDSYCAKIESHSHCQDGGAGGIPSRSQPGQGNSVKLCLGSEFRNQNWVRLLIFDLWV